MIKYFFLGFWVQLVTSLDDTLTRIPISASLTRTLKGKIVFSIGNIFAVCLAVIIAIFLSSFLITLSSARYIVAGLLFLLALLVYIDIFKGRVSTKVEHVLVHPISTKRFMRLVGAGFVISFIMVSDDIITLAPLFFSRLCFRKNCCNSWNCLSNFFSNFYSN